MAAYSGAPLQRLYALAQSALATIPNSGGTLTNTGNKLIPHTRAELRRIVEMIEAEYKTGTGSMLAGIPGRHSGAFSIECPLMPSGAAGTAPNLAPVLNSIFGVAGTVVADTSVTYNQADGIGIPLILALFNETGSGNTDQFGFGGTPQNFTINLGGNGYASLSVDGLFYYLLELDNFANEDTAGKGGLTTWPSEPSSPTLAGNVIPAFAAASVTVGGSAVEEFVSAQISGNTGRTLRMDGGKYPTAVVQGRRRISLRSLKFADSDGAALTTIKNAAKSKAALDVVIQQGITAGYIMTHTLQDVQFGNARFSESGAGVDIDFDDSAAHASALANTNEYVLAFT